MQLRDTHGNGTGVVSKHKYLMKEVDLGPCEMEVGGVFVGRLLGGLACVDTRMCNHCPEDGECLLQTHKKEEESIDKS